MAYSGPYGSVEGVRGYVRHITFDQANAPSSADLERWLTERAATLTTWLVAAGYAVPVDADISAEATAVLDRYANLGAAGDAELAQRHGGYDDEDDDRREVFFFREFAKAEAWIASGALQALGVPLDEEPARPARRATIGTLTAGTANDPRQAPGRGGLRS